MHENNCRLHAYSPDLNLVDYRAWGILLEEVYQNTHHSSGRPKASTKSGQARSRTLATTIHHWKRRLLSVCAKADGRHFECVTDVNIVLLATAVAVLTTQTVQICLYKLHTHTHTHTHTHLHTHTHTYIQGGAKKRGHPISSQIF